MYLLSLELVEQKNRRSLNQLYSPDGSIVR